MLEITVIKQKLYKPWISTVALRSKPQIKKKKAVAEIKRVVCKYEPFVLVQRACVWCLIVLQRGADDILRNVWLKLTGEEEGRLERGRKMMSEAGILINTSKVHKLNC